MTDPRTRELLVEQAAGAWRPRRTDGGAGSLPAWHDLDQAGRLEAYEVARRTRLLEAALDPDGLSTTARAVLARLEEG
jgi:hypothetical protein